ncbi:AraC family ligand binding domain-containing protein [Nonomuraea ferruginea]
MRLEGMPAGHRLRYGPAAEGIERLEASLVGVAFSPHRHDTYAIGVTLAGVQTFRYRGESRHCLPGEWHVLHPDEVHDGAAGTGDGFGYRIFYIDPALVQEALGGAPLPFVADPVIRGRGVPASLAACLAGLDEPLDGFARVEVGVLVAGMLARYGSARYGSARYGRRGAAPDGGAGPGARADRERPGGAAAGRGVRAGGRAGPVDDRAPVQGRVRHEPDALPHHAAARPGAAAAPGGHSRRARPRWGRASPTRPT